uniref:CASPASE_P20 domain-containing protein n=1 Tax=Steinernema glaseri TaxID=37863 RepID=A0A1I8AQ48_9BILA
MRTLPLDDEEYPMSSEDKGRVLIINNMNFEDKEDPREGSEIDEQELRELFESFKFRVNVEKNLTAEDMEERVKQFASSSDHANASCAFVIVLTHGNSGVLVGTDGNYIEESMPRRYGSKKETYVWKDLSLLGQRDTGYTVKNPVHPNVERVETDGSQETPTIPEAADFLVFRATTDKYVSLRQPRRGSWFIQTICNVFKNCAQSHDVLSMYTKVNNLVSQLEWVNRKQMPEFTSRLRKNFYLFPPEERTTACTCSTRNASFNNSTSW